MEAVGESILGGRCGGVAVRREDGFILGYRTHHELMGDSSLQGYEDRFAIAVVGFCP